MSISEIFALGDGLYVPYTQKVRGGAGGVSPVGSVAVDMFDTGDMSGGTVLLALTMLRLSFGFRAIVVPTMITALDNLATPEGIRMIFSAGNRRVASALEEVKVPIAGSGQSVAKFDNLGLVLESDELSAQTVMQFIWSTNTNTVAYAARLFGAVFDAELIEREGSVSDFLAGVR